MLQTDVAIIGAGPSGIQASIHVSRKKITATVIGKPASSAIQGAKIENYFGFFGEIKGSEILNESIRQAKSFGVNFINSNVVSSVNEQHTFKFITEDDNVIRSKAVIIAAGISRKELGVPGEKKLFGKGVSYCASCDCNFYKGKTVAVIGNDTESAMSAELMTHYAHKVYWIFSNIKASQSVVNKAINSGAVAINGKIKSINGDEKVNSISISNGNKVAVDGVFIELGAKSAADIAMDIGVMPNIDDTITVDHNCFTGIRGVFACGDITGKPWQVAKAVGQGAVAGIAASDFIKSISDNNTSNPQTTCKNSPH
ncbi:MAG: NAD(P)/FAD-dependent oxidoreductase [archaeon]|nr:NAD(P)/FAD-dependent oxidoreductase [archaeon]